jgi:hypothetical protein
MTDTQALVTIEVAGRVISFRVPLERALHLAGQALSKGAARQAVLAQLIAAAGNRPKGA